MLYLGAKRLEFILQLLVANQLRTNSQARFPLTLAVPELTPNRLESIPVQVDSGGLFLFILIEPSETHVSPN